MGMGDRPSIGDEIRADTFDGIRMICQSDITYIIGYLRTVPHRDVRMYIRGSSSV